MKNAAPVNRKTGAAMRVANRFTALTERGVISPERNGCE